MSFLINNQREKYFSSGFETAFVKHTKKAFLELKCGDFFQGIKMMKGSGFGLTPSGDDFVSGVLLGLSINEKLYNKDLRTLKKSILKIALGKNLISNAFLYYSSTNAHFKRFKDFQYDFLYDFENLKPSLNKLISVGETSGADILTGYILTIKHKFGI
ncbi:MAG: DUF2877 domain-containing protein [Bacteroidales bacterium]|nr:DUF2877 domain-containing protein [Bacteroidales bacterium]